MKRIASILIILCVIISVSCNREDDVIPFEIVKPTEIIEGNDKHTTIVYDGDMIMNIYIEKVYTMPEDPPVGWHTHTEFERDTFNFNYINGTLSGYRRIIHRTSFSGVISLVEIIASVLYNEDNMIDTLFVNSLALPSSYLMLYKYDSKQRVSAIVNIFDDILLSDPPIYLFYDEIDNISSYCRYSESICSDASQYDDKSNPWFSINKMLGFPFYPGFQYLSKNNPLTIYNYQNINPTYPSEISFTYEYDEKGRLIGVNDNVEIRY